MKSVLLVDDEQQFVASLREGLLNCGRECNVLTAYNGKEALELLRKNDISLVVTDMKMPQMDGLQLLAAMSREFPTIPAIVMTAFGTPALEEQIATFGVRRYVEKPVDFKDLSGLIFEGIESPRTYIDGITLASFAQLVEAERKTAVLRVRSKADGGKVGQLHFLAGELSHAVADALEGTEAALEILGWADVTIELDESATVSERRSVGTALNQLLVEAFVMRDEKQRDGASSGVEEAAPESLEPDKPEAIEAESGDSEADSEAVEADDRQEVGSGDSDQGALEDLQMAEGMTNQVTSVLSSLRSAVPEVEGMGVISAEGLVIQVSIPPEWSSRGMDEDQISAMVSGLVGIAETSTTRFQKEQFQRVTVKSAEGYFAAVKINDDSYLFTITNEKAKLGMLYLSMEEAAKQLAPAMAFCA